ncbi:hypothetical protein M422DRAFT_27701 [Sphaerobolus stellatus SS14]|nr:hypothetical protein M422DRAFT_27701 [Sphaerobolus stellatus SS14]
MTSISNPSMDRHNSNDSERAVNPNDPVAYTSQYAPHNPSLATPQPPTSQFQEPAQSTTTDNANNAGIFATATETAKQYLPESVVGALKNVGVMERDTSVTDGTSLPSQETKFAPSWGGVGTLPGTLSETSVAKLPDEKKYENEVGHELGREGVLGTDAEERPVGVMDLLADQKRANPVAGVDTASKFINLDVLPTPQGTPGEGTTINHAILDNRPSESQSQPTPLQNGPERMQSEPSKEMEKAVNKPLPPVAGNTNDFKNTGSRLEEGKVADDKTYTEDQAKRKTARTEPPNQHHSAPTPPETPTQQGGVERKEEVHSEEGKGSDVKSEKSGKVPFTQKLKGEVKIISGKLGSNPAKVEEGQAMKKGTSGA